MLDVNKILLLNNSTECLPMKQKKILEKIQFEFFFHPFHCTFAGEKFWTKVFLSDDQVFTQLADIMIYQRKPLGRFRCGSVWTYL